LRAFLSYDIEDQNVLSRVSALQNELVATGADLKLVRPEILHFTMRFLGEIDEDQKDTIIKALEGKVRSLELNVRFTGVGTFPSEKRISVIWIGIDPKSSEALGEHAKIVNSKIDEIGSFHEDAHESFNPHVTIARVKTGMNKDALLKLIQAHKTEELGSAMIKNLKLKLSELSPLGPKYSDLHVFS
jgi:RNA 2',3'-cyclic 3'-phosphodiesterase